MMNADIKKEISGCLLCLRKGGIIIFPTTAGWTIGCDSNNTDAIKKLLHSNIGFFPAILLSDAGKLQKYVREIPESMFQLVEYSTRPLHLIIDAAINLPDGINPGSTAFTFAGDDFLNTLTGGFGKPIFTVILKNQDHPVKHETMFDYPLYVVNLRSGHNNTTDNLTVLKFAENGSFLIIKK
jgi:L-threonylcarbamoyladenylate synthase